MAGDSDALKARLEALFLEELSAQGERLEQGLQALVAARPATPPEVVTELFRTAHSLKGAALAVGARQVSAACHDLEELLGRVRDGRAELDGDALARMTRLLDRVVAVGADYGAASSGGPDEPARVTAAEPAAESASTSVDPERVAPAVTRREPMTLRLDGGKLDALMAQAGELMTAGYGAEVVVDGLTEVGRRLQRRRASWRVDRDTVLRSLPGGADRDRVGALLDGAEEDLHETSREVGRLHRLLADHQRELRVRTSGFTEAVRNTRLVPFTETTSGLGRTVRQVAAASDKQVRLVVDDAAVEVDKDLVAGLREALGHLVRNAVDHGIEDPAERGVAGKSDQGEVRVSVALRNGEIQVVVTDDGRGVDETKVLQAAADRAGPGGEPPDLAAHDAVFLPGLTTADRVSPVSGRGVGLDAVRAGVEGMGGTVRLRSRPGAGTDVTISVPLSMSTIRVLLLHAAGEVVAVPSAGVRQMVQLPTDATWLEGRTVVRFEGEAVPVTSLADMLGWNRESPTADVAPRSGVVLASGAETVVLAVDGVVAEREIVLHPAPRRLRGMSSLLGTAQLDDGTLALVLNPGSCVRSALAERPARSSTDEEVRPAPRVLLVEDSLTTRELERGMLESAGYSVTVAADGEQARAMLATTEVDAVVSDVNMPRMDGISLCRSVRESSRLASLPFVLVTSLHSPADRQAGLEAGADAYITKTGLSRENLLTTLDRLL